MRKATKPVEIFLPERVKRALEPGAKAYQLGECLVFVGQHPESGRWHLSISHPKRYPHWDEIKAARYQLVPNDITMAMLLPPKEQYVNIHPNCFHLWEIRENFPR